MINLIGWFIKITLFSVLILVLGNAVHWNGRTVSDQVKTQISHAERSEIAGKIRRWTGDVARDARRGVRAQKNAILKNSDRYDDEKRSEASPQERLPSSERQKLRALIQELNTTTSADRRGAH